MSRYVARHARKSAWKIESLDDLLNGPLEGWRAVLAYGSWFCMMFIIAWGVFFW